MQSPIYLSEEGGGWFWEGGYLGKTNCQRMSFMRTSKLQVENYNYDMRKLIEREREKKRKRRERKTQNNK